MHAATKDATRFAGTTASATASSTATPGCNCFTDYTSSSECHNGYGCSITEEPAGCGEEDW